MKNIYFGLLIILSVSCSPTSWLPLDIINPAEFTFPDTGKIVVLNSAYLPSAIPDRNNLLPKLPVNEQLIFDTLITANVFNGFFSVIDGSPNEELQKASYKEIRVNDTTNFLNPISASGVEYLCDSYDASFIISLEYYGFNIKREKTVYFEYYDESAGWLSSLEAPRHLVWRIYQKDGAILDQFVDADTLYWYEDIDSNGTIPELPDAIREAFFLAGEQYARRISPYWTEVSRKYYLISRDGDDISLDREKLILFKSGNKTNLSFKACFNLAVLSESEDKLQEAIIWLDEASKIKQSEVTVFYRVKLQERMESREIIDYQSGF